MPFNEILYRFPTTKWPIIKTITCSNVTDRIIAEVRGFTDTEINMGFCDNCFVPEILSGKGIQMRGSSFTFENQSEIFGFIS